MIEFTNEQMNIIKNNHMGANITFYKDDDNSDIILTINESNLVDGGCVVDDSICSGELTPGEAIANMLTLKILTSTIDGFDDLDLKNTYAVVDFRKDTTIISMGEYIINDISNNGNIAVLTGMNYLIELDENAWTFMKELFENSPVITINDLYNRIIQRFNRFMTKGYIPLYHGNRFPGAYDIGLDIRLERNPYEDNPSITFRTILKDISMLYLSSIRLNRDNELDLVPLGRYPKNIDDSTMPPPSGYNDREYIPTITIDSSDTYSKTLNYDQMSCFVPYGSFTKFDGIVEEDDVRIDKYITLELAPDRVDQSLFKVTHCVNYSSNPILSDIVLSSNSDIEKTMNAIESQRTQLTQWLISAELTTVPMYFLEAGDIVYVKGKTTIYNSDGLYKVQITSVIHTLNGHTQISCKEYPKVESSYSTGNGFTDNQQGTINDIYDKLGEIVNVIYPVGSIYMTVNDINPSDFFGGKWIEWGSGRVPVGISSDTEFDTVEKTGGEKYHALSREEISGHFWRGTLMPGDNINVSFNNGSTYGMRANLDKWYGDGHNNLQPYITCYMWKRVE